MQLLAGSSVHPAIRRGRARHRDRLNLPPNTAAHMHHGENMSCLRHAAPVDLGKGRRCSLCSLRLLILIAAGSGSRPSPCCSRVVEVELDHVQSAWIRFFQRPRIRQFQKTLRPAARRPTCPRRAASWPPTRQSMPRAAAGGRQQPKSVASDGAAHRTDSPAQSPGVRRCLKET